MKWLIKWVLIVFGVIAGTMVLFYLYYLLLGGMIDGYSGTATASLFSATVTVMCTVIILHKINSLKK